MALDYRDCTEVGIDTAPGGMPERPGGDSMMHRREFLATTAALAAAPRFAWGQAKRRVAIVVPTAPVSELYKSAGTDYGAYGLLIEGLEEHGWV